MLGRRGRGRQVKPLAGLVRWEQNKGGPGFIFIPDDFVLSASCTPKDFRASNPVEIAMSDSSGPSMVVCSGKNEET